MEKNESKTSRRTSAQMYPLIEAYERSGQTQKTFCAVHHIKVATFLYWLQKYREAKSPQLEGGNSFVALKVSSPLTSGKVEIVYPNGVRVCFQQAVPLSVLKELTAKYKV